jgi:uncharacterized protein
MKKAYLILCLALILGEGFSQTYTVETVPNTKLINNSYVSNPDNLLSNGAVNQINLLLDSLERKTTVQVSVVMLNSIGDNDVFDFAQSLFVRWGIGQAKNDNGLLILYVQDKRTIRFHTGYGVEGVLPDATCKRIQTQVMVPRFKEGNIDAGMIAGVEEVVKILNDENSSEIKLLDSSNITDRGAITFLIAFAWLVIGLIIFLVKFKSGFANSRNFHEEAPHSKMRWGKWLFWYYLIPVTLLLYDTFSKNVYLFYGSIYIYLALLAIGKYSRIVTGANRWLAKGQYHTVYDFLKHRKAIMAFVVLFPLPFAFLISDYKRRIRRARFHPRTCKNCGEIINAPLSEAAEDEYLQAQQIFEENLKSVDYDVWRCNHCGQVEFERYLNSSTKFKECSGCHAIALYTASSTTKLAATTTSTGIREIVKECKYCKKKFVEEETIPMISTSSDSDSSSSSDSGGSWGGGDSGGGGASSSW